VFSRMRVEVRASSLRKWSSRLREPVRGPWPGLPPAGGPATRRAARSAARFCCSGTAAASRGTNPSARSRIVLCGCEPRHVSRCAARARNAHLTNRGQKVSRKASACRRGRAHSAQVAGYDPQETETSQRLTDAVICVACGSSSGLNWRGWLAYRVEDPENVDPPELGFYCPDCAARDLGRPPRRP
jgi:hypothetical protein